MNDQAKLSENQKYLKIRLNAIHPSVPVPLDIYILIAGRYVHYLRSGDTLTAEKLKNFKEKAPDSFYIKAEEKKDFKDYVSKALKSNTIKPNEKALILRESSFSLVEELFESPDVAKALSESREVIDNFIEFMQTEPSAMADLLSLSSHDFYTYNHSLDVSIYSLGLGKTIGFNSDELRELGEGSLFHDIGKRQVAVEIITKDGPLDDVEWAQMRKHPEYGLAILNNHDVSEAVKACCFEHHESCLGNGYPQGLEGDEIHPLAKIIALTDTYDALTTQRSYNQPMTPFDALNFMNEKLAGKYDPDFLKAMHSVLFRMQKAS